MASRTYSEQPYNTQAYTVINVQIIENCTYHIILPPQISHNFTTQISHHKIKFSIAIIVDYSMSGINDGQ